MLTQTQLAMLHFTRRGNSRYGLGNPVSICGTSRKLNSYCGFFHFGPPFMVAQMGARKGCRFLLRRCAGFPTRLGCRPSMETKVAVIKTAPSEANMAHQLSPVSTNPYFFSGPLLVFEADDHDLVAQGLIQSCDLPKKWRGCRTCHRHQRGTDFQSAYRMADGRTRLTVSAHLVRQRDAGFIDFLAQTVGRAAIELSIGVAA
jgi:hypothetical protein